MIVTRLFTILACGSLLLGGVLAAPAQAQPNVALDSAVFVEKTRPSGTNAIRTLEKANRLTRGDRVVTLVTWYRLGGSGGFTVVNALPQSLAYQGSAEGVEEVSADGGKSWGRLGTLHKGNRIATPEDITHIRWHVSPVEAQSGTGHIAYAGFVR